MGQILQFLAAFRQRASRPLHVHQILTLQRKQATRTDVRKSLQIDFI